MFFNTDSLLKTATVTAPHGFPLVSTVDNGGRHGPIVARRHRRVLAGRRQPCQLGAPVPTVRIACHAAPPPPAGGWALCAELNARVIARTGSTKVAIGAISQALLARYVSPALASPKAYGLVAVQPPERSKKVLVLLSYVVRHLGMGTAFNISKDPSKADLNAFLLAHSDILSEYLARMSLAVADFPADLSTEFVADPDAHARSLVEMRAVLAGDVLESVCGRLSVSSVVEEVRARAAGERRRGCARGRLLMPRLGCAVPWREGGRGPRVPQTIDYRVLDRVSVVLADRLSRQGRRP